LGNPSVTEEKASFQPETMPKAVKLTSDWLPISSLVTEVLSLPHN